MEEYDCATFLLPCPPMPSIENFVLDRLFANLTVCCSAE